MHFSIGIRFRKSRILFVCVQMPGVSLLCIYGAPLTFEVHLSVQINKSHKFKSSTAPISCVIWGFHQPIKYQLAARNLFHGYHQDNLDEGGKKLILNIIGKIFREMTRVEALLRHPLQLDQ